MSRYKDQPKNPRREVQTAPEHETAFRATGPMFGTLKGPNFHVLGFGPTAFR